MSTIEQALAKKLAAEKASKKLLQEPDITHATEEENTVDQVAIEIPQAVEPTHNKDENFLTINQDRLTKNDFIDIQKNSPHNVLREEFRQIKRKLINNAFGAVSKTLEHPNLVMITSAKANEGKTFVSINLALSIASEQDKTVLLVDADVLKPSILKEFGLQPHRGLIEYLLGDIEDVSSIIYHSNIDNLKIIPAGTPHHLSNELLASERMTTLATELSTRYPDRIVIFDSPPLLGVNETPVLAHLMGQALITVEEGKTSINDVNQASGLLNDKIAKGIVLNKAYYSQKEMYGYYGYGYGKRAAE
ncbi:XrtA-associated tyrosine autokinase [Thalassotalea psychrophila]|uniref:non-specific protein-tyrosine kinase n=1 Tax=Thalassotalea psychrophila TaxID=3065647 RepID=A0ABY9TYK0_9GAMM|nr:XrtA-associated tyrosine autokinase [Colwelliaceae bacterium SQ149]